jgi:hypothetical protein
MKWLNLTAGVKKIDRCDEGQTIDLDIFNGHCMVKFLGSPGISCGGNPV